MCSNKNTTVEGGGTGYLRCRYVRTCMRSHCMCMFTCEKLQKLLQLYLCTQSAVIILCCGDVRRRRYVCILYVLTLMQFWVQSNNIRIWPTTANG